MRFIECHVGEVELPEIPQGGLESGIALIPGKPVKVYPFGDVTAPDGRKIRVTKENGQELVDDANARTVDIAILYEHGKDVTKGLAAAGWASPGSFELRADGVWANVVNWTRSGFKEVLEQTRRFVSGSAYHDMAEDGYAIPRKFREISITSVPAYVKNMEPVSASGDDGEGGTMDAKIREKLVATYKLPADATDEAILAAMEKAPEPEKKVEASALDEKRVVELAAAETKKAMDAFEAGATKKAAEDFVATLVTAGKLTTDAEKKSALESAARDLEGFKVIAANLPVKSPVTKIQLGADGKPPKPHKADFIGMSAEAGNLDGHRKVLEYMEASGETDYTKAVLASGRK